VAVGAVQIASGISADGPARWGVSGWLRVESVRAATRRPSPFLSAETPVSGAGGYFFSVPRYATRASMSSAGSLS